MRATSPADAIGGTGRYDPIPQPKLAIGTRLDLTKISVKERPYYIKRIRTELIRRTRGIIDGMRAEGYFKEMVGNKLLDCHKNALREKFRFMELADGAFVVGHTPNEMQSNDNIANQCFMTGGPGWGKMTFHYHLLFRKYSDGKHLIYTLPFALLDEWRAVQCAVKPDQVETVAAAG